MCGAGLVHSACALQLCSETGGFIITPLKHVANPSVCFRGARVALERRRHRNDDDAARSYLIGWLIVTALRQSRMKFRFAACFLAPGRRIRCERSRLRQQR
ncbi:hypothetical protein AAFF_G00238980 [Aldrovandia affinis]|uniref:Uncharacterized protein n=1 Tax=Aldrovandia affinis TaxID=143900 RepID=A0AAD7W3M9_9TELE|nr:hypothetical protein AAFF_G00238980 [Aldrovandia affinis]